MDKWDERMFNLARKEVATWSKDPEGGVGCVVVSPDRCQVTWGFNGFPRGIEDTEKRLNDRGLKNSLMVHAELNALLNAKVDITGWTLYVTKAPCTECAKAIIQRGITCVMCPELRPTSRWFFNQRDASVLLEEAGIDANYIRAWSIYEI